MNRIIITKRYNYATVFVDHFFRYSYMHLQHTASTEDTIEVNHAFERMAASYVIIIKLNMLKMESSEKMPGSKTAKSVPVHS